MQSASSPRVRRVPRNRTSRPGSFLSCASCGGRGANRRGSCRGHGVCSGHRHHRRSRGGVAADTLAAAARIAVGAVRQALQEQQVLQGQLSAR